MNCMITGVLTQKGITTDFLTKRRKPNEGEAPQYYVEQSHEAIIPPDEWEIVQLEMVRRKSRGRKYSGHSIFSSRIICGDCGEAFGSKVWNSTDKYRRTVWQCNGKYKGEHRCNTPHLDEEQISLFVSWRELIGGEVVEWILYPRNFIMVDALAAIE